MLIRLLLFALAVPVATLAIVLAGLTLTAYRPRPDEPALPVGPAPLPAPLGPALRIASWNIGYAGLDASADFFMDGGRGSRAPSAERVEANLAAAIETLAGLDAGLLLLQEVDRRADRTFRIDEAARLAAAFAPRLGAYYSTNYRTPYVPVPWRRPMGRVESGLLSLAPAAPEAARRLALPGNHPWPRRLFHLRRCLTLLRFPAGAPGAPGWSIVNLHLEAFDRGGDLRRLQLAYLRELLLAEHAAGRRCIAGGDWNCEFPGVDRSRFPAREDERRLFWLQAIPAGWTPAGWRWAFDPERPTVRTNGSPYRPGLNRRTIVDGFLVSPGVEIVSARTLDLEFAASDHNPVVLEVR